MFNREELPYRLSTLGVLKNQSGQFLLVQKLAYQDDQWSFPGGGIDEGETPRQAVERELQEELGTASFSVIAQSDIGYRYEWPDDIIQKQYNKKGKWWRGQQIIFLLAEFTGDKSDIHIQKSELKNSRWVTAKELEKHLIFPNQYEMTQKVLADWKLL
ncbi:hypothetical protein A2368_02125 [Candidatus Collierbacteria bacterium RIFOXYB1_FULL_49_13]|uniref:Nudix hydrolase domain-containing protein n=1 Tax=Candidatus Collierbacteria bacterium RIFOXYB1_FULL_49_13 TaxID=1817728 RepID=A0A1F5FGL1_9BACT|nr:MAG: hypothetical protein A2368_02125 [Candidatus Collierbacteria bacterium RIFOXYB1_FULL_49_13]